MSRTIFLELCRVDLSTGNPKAITAAIFLTDDFVRTALRLRGLVLPLVQHILSAFVSKDGMSGKKNASMHARTRVREPQGTPSVDVKASGTVR